MSKFSSLSDTEMKVMQVIWKLDRPVVSSELLAFFSKTEGKEWRGQTIATFLSRLADKGLLTIKRQGRGNVYTACMTYKEYKKKEAQSVIIYIMVPSKISLQHFMKMKFLKMN